MIRIVSSKKKLDQALEELELEYSKGNISKKEYFAQKRGIGQEMETLQTAERVRRMQQGQGSEKTLDHWTDKEEEKKKLADDAEKQEMLKKYITRPESIKNKSREMPSREWMGKRAKIGLVAFVLLAFVVGTSLGSVFITKPSEVPQVSMSVNASAFLPVPVNNTTTTTSNYTVTKTPTKNTTVTKTTPTPTPTPQPTPTPSNETG
ncbi:MAG: hypothetical protein KO318_11905 [Methanobacterium sp.]|uniref:hypothetical protein n=1 Tax=Methanobacterium sp. TaxID=2164 RepID=UPI0025865228|nr:hypothetical protein [Methanobacterium sp.]MCC7561112.1 hypothetical protein [Methanobacterium sp.]